MADPPPTIHYAAAVGPDGAVHRGRECTKAEAVAWRRLGKDIVVCGDGTAANRQLARKIEEAVAGVGNVVAHRRHDRAGKMSLPHFQPAVRPPRGHTFFETNRRKAVS